MCNVENKIKDEELLKFLKFSYFGNLTISIEVASNRAYRDMNRTIRFNEFSTEDIRLELREKVNNIFEIEIKKLTENNITSQEEFDLWHCDVCKVIRSFYLNEGIEFSYGQAQKWVNMTIKYLYIFNIYSFDSVFEFLHLPIDNYVFDAVKEKLVIEKPVDAWSRWDYYKDYLDYQNKIKSKIKIAPLRWEFENWLDVAQNKN